MNWGEVFYQNGKILDGYFFRKYILSFKLFFKSDTVNSKQELLRTRNYFRKENIKKIVPIKVENRLHEIIKILFTRKIKFRKI